MENTMDIFFGEVFAPLNRDCLLEQRCRKYLSDYLNAIIEASLQTDGLQLDIASIKVIQRIIHFHKNRKHENSGICPMGKHHNILYVAASICKDKYINDSDTVCSILDEIFNCENTFERLFLGALFGKKAGQFLFGWKCDQDSQEECVQALAYYIRHATLGKRVYKFYSLKMLCKNQVLPFVDLPLDCCSKASPVRIVLRLGFPEMLMLLLQYGANPNPTEKDESAIEDLLHDVVQDEGLNFRYVECLRILLRAIPTIPLRKSFDWYNLRDMRKSFFNRFPHLKDPDLLPGSRCSKTPPELKHLCRCVTRKRLAENFQLPIGIPKLGLTRSLQHYLNLSID